MDNINITNEIFLRLERIGVKFNNDSQRKVVRFYLDKNFNMLYGKNKFSTDEMEIVIMNDSFRIKNIFGEEVILESLHEDKSYYNVLRAVTTDNKVVFEIDANDFTNKYFDSKENKIYAQSIKKGYFKYSSGHLEDESYVCDYEGQLRTVNAKLKNTELYEYDRLIPPEVKEQGSKLQQILKRVQDNGLIKIETSYELADEMDYLDSIFHELEKKEIEHQQKMTKI